MAKTIKILTKWDDSPLVEMLGAVSIFGLFFGFLLLPVLF